MYEIFSLPFVYGLSSSEGLRTLFTFLIEISFPSKSLKNWRVWFGPKVSNLERDFKLVAESIVFITFSQFFVSYCYNSALLTFWSSIWFFSSRILNVEIESSTFGNCSITSMGISTNSARSYLRIDSLNSEFITEVSRSVRRIDA